MLRHSQHFLLRTLIFFVGFLSVCVGSWGRSRGFRRIKEESKTAKNSWGTCGSILWRADDFQNALRVSYPFKHERCFSFFNFWPLLVKVQWNIDFGTPLFKGHKIWPRKKNVHMYCNLCICYLYWRDTSTQGKGTLFLVPKLRFNLH